MKIKKLYPLLLISSFTAHTAEQAAETKTIDQVAKTNLIDCSKNKTPVSFARCLDNKKDTLDRTLKIWLNNQEFALTETAKSTGRKSALNMFKKAQRNFINYRENNCRWRYLNRLPHDDANILYKQCYIRLTQNRINELSDKPSK